MTLSRKNTILTVLLIAVLVVTLLPFWSDLIYKGLLYALYRPALFLTVLLIITWPWHTIPTRLILFAFLLGGSVVIGVTILLQILLVAILNLTPDVVMSIANFIFGKTLDIKVVIVSPVTEEILKVLPIIVILFVGPWRHLRRTAGPLDFALLGAALGGGFEFTETVFMRHGSSIALPSLMSPLLPTLRMWNPLSGTHWFGHAGTAALLALAIGLALRLGVRRKAWWTLPALIWSLVTFEHFMVNFGERPSRFWLQALYNIDRAGLLGSNLFVIGLAVAAAISTIIFFRYRRIDQEARIDFKETAQTITATKEGFFGNIWLTLLLLRLWKALTFGFDSLGRTEEPQDLVAINLDSLRQIFLALRNALTRALPSSEPQIPS